MTPKHKAEELVKKYSLLSWKGKEFEFEYYKQCALIAVDLAIEVETNIFKAKVHKSYWQEVKQEIEKL